MGYNNVFATSKVDPIEIVSSLCSLDSFNIDLVDNFGRTPLSYASQRGSIVCALYLLERGALLERIDNDGNTPLAISLLK
jgi:ankyrin repeat protein